MTKPKNLPKNYQVTWDDLEPWVQQLHEEHGVLLTVTVHLEGITTGLKPAVRVVGRRWREGTQYDEIFNNWTVFDLRSIGEVEKHALHLVSTALLALDNDKWRAERSQTPLFP